MFSTSFRRPIGAAADAKELEYVTALHQTVDENEDEFADGSIEAKDVKYYLMSRYGIDVTVEQIQKLVFHDLAGGSNETDCIDICELVAILLIPLLVKSKTADADFSSDRNVMERSIARAFSSKKQMKSYLDDIQLCNTLFSKGAVIEHVLNIIMADTTGSVEPQRITKELITTIFARYGELELINDDDLIQEMIDDVSGGDPNALLDAQSFARALTNDILLYDASNETRVSTFYEDVFGREAGVGRSAESSGADETNPIVQVEDPENIDVKQMKSTSPRFTNVFTCSQVDFMADSCRSKMHLAIVYLSFIFFIYYYRNPGGLSSLRPCSTSGFGCQIANSVTGWLLIMSFTISFGVPYILSMTCGNTLRGRSFKNPLIGIGGVVFFVVLPITIPFDFIWISNEYAMANNSDGWENLQTLFIRLIQSLIIVVLLFIQIMNLVKVIKPTLAQSSNQKLSFLFTRGTVRETFLLKLSASLKIHRMVKNALDLHFGDNKDLNALLTEPNQSSTNALALLNYSKVTEKRETVGGLWWCWKSYIDRSLIQKEGIMVNSRLILCNLLQFFLVIVLCFQMPQLTITTLAPAIFPSMTHEVTECDESTFDPSKCFFPSVAGVPAGMGVCRGVKMEDPKCVSEEYFTPLIPDTDDRQAYLCEGMLNFLDNANQTAWSLIYFGDKSQEFTELSTNVVNAILCGGLDEFNQTLWSAFSNVTTNSAIELCDVPQESFCDIASGRSTGLDYQSAMDSLLLSYEDKYRRTFEPAIACLEQSTNINALNYVFNQATGSLQEMLASSVESSWGALFPNFSNDSVIDEQLRQYVAFTIGAVFSDQLFEGITVMNTTEIVKRIQTPVLSLASDILLIENIAMNLIDSVFLELNTSLAATMTAIESNLAVLPPYVNIPYLPVKSLCSNIWNVRYNATLLVSSVGSTEDEYCHAHLTTCTTTGICLIGLDSAQQGSMSTYFPFQFEGEKCSEYKNLEPIMETKKQLGTWASYIPSLTLINFSISMGVILSIICLLGITGLFIPNVILTTLKYRSGALPSLLDERFNKYRKNLTSLTLLVPVVFWSAFAMTFLFFFAVCLAIFVLFSKATRSLVIQLIALIIGVVICVLMKQIIVCTLGRFCYAGFYRRKPAAINITSVALECWHIFLSLAFVSARAGILIFMSLLFIGRVDRTLLADDLELDKFPHLFRQAILASDAHRHPYIEQLGMMYLMKLKHGSNFGKKSSSIWRLLFVFALMPWLRKYRIINELTSSDVDRAKVEEAFEMVKFKSNEIDELKEQIATLEEQLRLAQEQNENNQDNSDGKGEHDNLSFFDDDSTKPLSPLSCMG